MKSIFYAGVIALSVSGCQLLNDRDNQVAAATITGAGAGILLAAGLYGSGTPGVIAMLGLGATGAAGGYYLAQELLPQEKEALNNAAYKSLESTKVGETVNWHDKNTGNFGAFTPTREFSDTQGRQCRTLESRITVGKDTANSEATACRIDDSAWRVT